MGLTDAELRDLYHSSDIAFIPLTNATANNAVLEAMASGIPLISTDLPAIRGTAGRIRFSFPLMTRRLLYMLLRP